MKKVGTTLYNKLLLQSEEAKERGLTSLASALDEVLGPYPEETEVYSHDELKEDVYKAMWKIVASVSTHYDLQSLDAGKIDDFVSYLSESVISKVEDKLSLKANKNTKEPKIIGEE